MPVPERPAPRTACLGECMMELVERPDGLLSRAWGGDTLNTALYLARLDVAVDYVTALGDDPFSDAMLAGWQAEGIGTGHVLRLPGRLPGLYLIQTDSKGERRFSYWRDRAPVRDLFAVPDTPRIEAALEAFDLVYLSGITLSLFGAAGREQLFATLDRLRARGGNVAFDTNFRPRGWPDRAEAQHAYASMLRRTDTALGSVEDLALLHGEATPDGAAALLHAGGAREVVVKLESPACHVHHAGGTIFVPAEPVQDVVDTTAAGDSFAAAYLASRLRGETPEQAARAGHRLAGTVVQHRGAIIPRGAMPAPRGAMPAMFPETRP